MGTFKHYSLLKLCTGFAAALKFIKTKIVLNDQENYQRGADANRQSKNIDGRKNFITPKISQGDFEIIFEHDIEFVVRNSFVPINAIFISIIHSVNSVPDLHLQP